VSSDAVVKAYPGLARPKGVHETLAIFNDPWTFALLQEAFFGVRRFDEFHRFLKISRNVLTKRLKLLVQHGILDRCLYQRRPDRFEYRLSDKGRALYPIFLAMDQWGREWLDTGLPPDWESVHLTCGASARPRMTCDHCGEVIDARDMGVRLQQR
jgi:DNA-binding HxlR family transcriptional regulator